MEGVFSIIPLRNLRFLKTNAWCLGLILSFSAAVLAGCSGSDGQAATGKTVPHQDRWGIYELDLATRNAQLIFSTPDQISGLRLSHSGDRFVFAQEVGGRGQNFEEIATVNTRGLGYQQLTDNHRLDTYPIWSPDDTEIAFLSRYDTLDIYKMMSDGSGVRELYDSGSNDADIDWVKNEIVFTRHSSVWIMNQDATAPTQVTHPPREGQKSNANLPFGDYDPRLSGDGLEILFERLVDDAGPHGNYDFFLTSLDGRVVTRLTNTGYSQGLASWSHSGDKIVYIVAAIGDKGVYDLYMMNADGTDNQNITPDYFPDSFLAHSAVFSGDDRKIYFIGEWWE